MRTRVAPPSPLPLTGQRVVGFMLAHEQFTLSQLVEIGTAAADAGFGLLATSDLFCLGKRMRAIAARPG